MSERAIFGATLGVMGCIGLVACAKVSAVPLDPSGIDAIPGATPGFRYYMPRPYLLVTKLPSEAPAGGAPKSVSIQPFCDPTKTECPKNDQPPPPGASKGAAPKNGTSKDGNSTDTGSSGKTETPGQQNAPAAAPPTDTSFMASTATYMVKLVYLPDYSRPMAVNMDSGLLGVTSIQLTLQDGWMLTNVSANSDNSKTADVLTAAISALTGNAASGAAKSTSSSSKGSPPGGLGTIPPNQILRPGLYAFDYDYGMSRVSFVCAVAYFDARGTIRPTYPRDRGACGPDMFRPPSAAISALN
jgi:hypothetical protein